MFCIFLDLGLTRTDVVGLCVAFGITSHYAWLVAFVWMNILAIDIYRTFGLGTRITDAGGRYFRYYALYGMGAPAGVVGACAALSFCDCAGVEVRYASRDACWIGGPTANLVAFGLPIAAILAANAVLFTLTVAGVVKTRRASSRMNITQGQGDSTIKMRSDIILYLKVRAAIVPFFLKIKSNSQVYNNKLLASDGGAIPGDIYGTNGYSF